jgi:glycosyltransferase involved in cell wall biosynthesis
VVSSNTSSLPEVVGQAGLLASPTNTSEFDQQLLRLVRDQSLRERFGQEGRERIKRNFSWDVAARTTLKAYKRVIERSTRSDYR